MAKRLYGSVCNRIEEGHNYNEDKLIHEGDDITLYHWSDRSCYFVTKVINQKNIFVHKYHVCADHSKAGGMGHQNWLYFKTLKEETEYLNDCIDKGLITGCDKDDVTNIHEDEDVEWVYRYNHWYTVNRITPEKWNAKMKMVIEKEASKTATEEQILSLTAWYFGWLTDEEIKQVMSCKTVVKYYKIGDGISFGVRSYYYDWEF